MKAYKISVIFRSQKTDAKEGLSGLDAALQIHRWFAKSYDPPIIIEAELVEAELVEAELVEAEVIKDFKKLGISIDKLIECL